MQQVTLIDPVRPDAILLVGHGAAARDTPRELVRRLKALESQREQSGAPASPEERALDDHVRRWPRSASNDPYRAGVEALAERMRKIAAPIPVVVAFNELCAPSIDEAVDGLVAAGVRSLVVVTTMVTQGGVHAERDIPEQVAALSRRFPNVTIDFAWPFDADAVAWLLYAQAIRRAARRGPA